MIMSKFKKANLNRPGWSVQTLRIAFKRAAMTSLPHNLDKSAVVKIFEGLI